MWFVIFDSMELVDVKYFPILTFLISIIISSLKTAEIPVVYRMTQFDSMGVQYGCRFSNLNLEIKSLQSRSTNRNCVLAKMEDLTVSLYLNVIKNSGGLIIQLPENFSNLSMDTKTGIYEIERLMLTTSVNIPVYFSPYNAYLENMINEISKEDGEKNPQPQSSAFNNLIKLIMSNGYQAILTGSSHTPNENIKLTITKGELIPVQKSKTSRNKLPTILITSNITPFRVTNHISFNPDAALMLSIIDIFSKFYNSKHSSPNFKIVFLLSESGSLLNFQGTRKWLEDNQLQDIEFALCLDTINQPTLLEKDRNLYMHVSKPPKEGSTLNKFFKLFKETAETRNITVEGVHKRINLAEAQVAWEHERFGIKKIPSFTLSNVKNFKSIARNTIFVDQELSNTFYLNSEIVIETLFKYVFDIGDKEFSSYVLDINKSTTLSWRKMKSTLQTKDLQIAFEKYLRNVRASFDKPDHRDPEFLLYNGPEAKLYIHNVKPAAFDLFLTMFIALYLLFFYFVLNYFTDFYENLKQEFYSRKRNY